MPEVQALRGTAVRPDDPGSARSSARLHGLVLTLLAVGGAVGLVLWGKWGFLIALDTIRTYCF